MHKSREPIDQQQAAMRAPRAKSRPWDVKAIHPGNNKSTIIVPSGKYNRIERDPFYHTNRWKKASSRFLKDHPLCAGCSAQGIIRASKVTDHIVPKPICQDPMDESNWQALCYSCHKEKSAKDKQLIAKHNKR